MIENNGNEINRRADVENYRKQRAEQFRLNISGDTLQKPASDFSDEITSFSDENTKAQIERDSRKALRLQKKEEKKIEKIKSSRNKKVYRIAWLQIVFLLSVALSYFLILGCNDFLAISREENTSVETIRIETNDDPSDIAKKLAEKGVIKSKAFFVLFSNITGKADGIEPGIYQIPANKDYLGILNHLQYTDNRDVTITLRVAEGTNVNDLAKQLYDAGVTYDSEEFLKLCNSNEFDDEYPFLAAIPENPDRVYRLEGYLFPDTYEFYVDEAPELTIRRFLDNFETRIYEAEYEVEGFENPVTISQLVHDKGDYTLDEYVNLASIVLGEAADPDDMYDVSSVIHNRLDYGFEHDIHTLDMDSTAFYPYSSKEAIPEDIADTFVSKYNTYNVKGLPPSAICSPSVDALLATLLPNDTDYLYFCHSEDGTSYFAVTFDVHQENLKKAGLS